MHRSLNPEDQFLAVALAVVGVLATGLLVLLLVGLTLAIGWWIVPAALVALWLGFRYYRVIARWIREDVL